MKHGLPMAVAVCLFSLGAFLPRTQAASSALIVTGLSSSAQSSEEFQRLALETKRLLVERGMPADQVKILSENVTKDAVLGELAGARNSNSGDEFWLVLFGYGGKAQGGVPAFQVRGPRLTADDMKSALDSIPAKQFVFLGASDSGAFLPPLKSNRRTVLSATKEIGEQDWPRFPDAWVKAFSENPKASLARIAARAAETVEQEYHQTNLAQVEHARLSDPVAGAILEPPFGVDLKAEKELPSIPGVSSNGFTASDIKVEIKKPSAEWEQQPASEETKKIVSEARAVPNPDGHAAMVLQQRLGFTVEEDRTTERTMFYRVFIARDEAVQEWANQFFPQSPPALTTKLEVARVIHPDGTSTVYNPAKLLACNDPEGGCGAAARVFLPGATAGCVIEVGYRTRQILNATLPQVSETLPLLQTAPALKTSLEIRVPEKPVHHVVLRNTEAQPQESTEGKRRVYRWELGALPAAEQLPGDPPWQQWAAHAEVSSLPSWDEFAKWYRRLAEGSDEADETVKKMAAQLADGAKDRVEKIRRDFEYVSALRYVAIEIGVQGFRPRTPKQVLANNYGDCKDKANLLVALLGCQGIPANFVLLNRGGATDVNFPSWQFNHAIAFVPRSPEQGQSEDLWLDATDSVTPFGFVAPGDFGRDALVFGKDTAEFKTVSTSSSAVSEIRDDWALKEDPQGGWKGDFHRNTTGTVDDNLRRALRGLTPAQRTAQLYAILSQLCPTADFMKVEAKGVSALGSSVELAAETVIPPDALPCITAPELALFTAPERSRPLLLNEGQPLVLNQTLRLVYASTAPKQLPEPVQLEVAGEKLSVTWARADERTWVRTTRLELLRPTISASDYSAVRQMLRKWSAAQSRPGNPVLASFPNL